MKYLVVGIICNNVEKAIQCVTNEEAIETYNKLCNYYYNDDGLATFMQNNNYEKKNNRSFWQLLQIRRVLQFWRQFKRSNNWNRII